MIEQEEKSSFLNNAFVVLVMIFTIPALLVVAATYITAQYGRVPGGTTSECQRTLDDVTIRADLYRYQAGLTSYETQTFFVRQNNMAWLEFFRVDIQAPQDFDCDKNIRQLDENTILITTQKGIALSHDNGATWNRHTVCNPPRPEGGRCIASPLNIADITVEDTHHIQLVVQEAVTDQYGVIVPDENGQQRIINEYILVTEDGGQTWNLAND